jgi:hypothetical protein
MLIGGFAVIAHGVRRTTEDLDLVVRGDATNARELLRALAAYGIRPRIPDAEAFARSSLVLLLRDEVNGVPVDLSFGWSDFEHDALERRAQEKFGKTQVPVAAVEDLVVYKAIAGRPKDIEDAETLLLTHGKLDVRRIRKWVRILADTADAPEMAERLDELFASVKKLRS